MKMSKGFFSPIAVAALALSTAPTGAATIPIGNTVVLPGITGGVYAEAGITFGDFETATLNAPPSMLPLKVTAQNLDAGAAAAATGGSDPARSPSRCRLEATLWALKRMQARL
jgi:hypothetical protein